MMETVQRCLQPESTPWFSGQDVLLREIREVSRQISCNNAWFEIECNGDLIEACIYQDQALRARYRYLLGIARQQGVSAPPFPEDSKL